MLRRIPSPRAISLSSALVGGSPAASDVGAQKRKPGDVDASGEHQVRRARRGRTSTKRKGGGHNGDVSRRSTHSVR